MSVSRSVSGMCLCPRHGLISGKPCWNWETLSWLTLTLLGLHTGSKSFPPSGFPSHHQCIPSHLLLTFTSALLSERRNTISLFHQVFPSWMEKLVGFLWFIVVISLFFLPQSGNLDTTWQRESLGEKERLGCGFDPGAEWDSLYMIKEESQFLQHFCSFWGKKKSGLFQADIFSIHSLWIFWEQCCQVKQRSPNKNYTRQNWRPQHSPHPV